MKGPDYHEQLQRDLEALRLILRGGSVVDWRRLHFRDGAEVDLSRPAPAGSYPAGAAPSGARQLIGDVWEWTASDFLPYPGFRAWPYREYSEVFFGDEYKVLRGGCFATRGRMIRAAYRNFYTPDRRDVLAGFRTCAR